jgi:four helix bundle protein
MVIKRFEEIISWQKARELNLIIYNHFKNSKDFGFRDQIQRASVSIMNNIAEGFERGGNKELRNYLYISKASCAEVRSMLYLALDLEFMTKEQFAKTYGLSIDISNLLSGFIKTL